MFWKDLSFTTLVWDPSLQRNNFSGKTKSLLSGKTFSLFNYVWGGREVVTFSGIEDNSGVYHAEYKQSNLLGLYMFEG